MISFVGAGPGAPDLITLRGAARLAAAEVVVWASSLVPEAVLDHAPPGATVHDSATMTLEDVLAVYEATPDAAIVRLHSGDPTLYGAVQEQIAWCLEHERSWEIVPGVSSVAAAAAAASVPARESVAGYAALGATLAVFLSAARPAELQSELLAPGSAFTAETPAVIVIRASWPDERVIPTTVGGLAAALSSSGATMTVLVLVGEVLRSATPAARSHLYAPGYAHSYRMRSTAGSTTGRPASRPPR